MFQHKMGEARRHLSLQNFNQSFLFAESMIHDVQALHKLIHLAGKNLHTYFYCEVVNLTYLVILILNRKIAHKLSIM